MRRPNRAAARVRSRDAPGARAECRARLRDELLRSLALRERRHDDDAGASFFGTARRPWDGSTARGEAGHGRRVARAVDERVRVPSPPRPRRCRGSGGGEEAEVIRGDAQRQARARHVWRSARRTLPKDGHELTLVCWCSLKGWNLTNELTRGIWRVSGAEHWARVGSRRARTVGTLLVVARRTPTARGTASSPGIGGGTDTTGAG